MESSLIGDDYVQGHWIGVGDLIEEESVDIPVDGRGEQQLDGVRAVDLQSFVQMAPLVAHRIRRMHAHASSAHELCRLIMQAEARNAGTNRLFSTDESNRAAAMNEIESELGPLQRAVPPSAMEGWMDQLFRGVMSQLYNLPVDMIIERRIATRHLALRYAQVESFVLEKSPPGIHKLVSKIPRPFSAVMLGPRWPHC